MWTLLGVIAGAGFVAHLLAWLTSNDPVFRRQEAPFTASALFFVVFWVVSLTTPNGGILVDVIRGLAFVISMGLLVVWGRRRPKRNFSGTAPHTRSDSD